MTTKTIAQTRLDLSETVSRVLYQHERVIITRRGKPAAALVPVEDLELLKQLEDEIDLRDAKAALADIKKTGGVMPFKAFKKHLEKKG